MGPRQGRCSLPRPSQTGGQIMKTLFTRDAVAELALPTEKSDMWVWDSETAGLGLRLRRGAAGVSRTWYLSYTIAGEDRRDPLGKYSDLTLDEARALVQRRRRDLAEGTIDPRVVKAQQAAESIACKTLREAALAYLAKHSAGWSESTRRGHERYLVGTDVSESYFK